MSAPEITALWSNRGEGVYFAVCQRERNLCQLLRELYDAKMASDWTRAAQAWDAAFDLCYLPAHLKALADAAMDIGVTNLEGGRLLADEDVTNWMRRSVLAALEVRKVDESDERAAEFTANLAKAYVRLGNPHLAESCVDAWMSNHNKNKNNSKGLPDMLLTKLHCCLELQRPLESARAVLLRVLRLPALEPGRVSSLMAMLSRTDKYEELAREAAERALLKDDDEAQKGIWHVWRIRLDIRNQNDIAAYDDLSDYVQWFFARKASEGGGDDGNRQEDASGYESVIQDCEQLVVSLRQRAEQSEVLRFCKALIFLCGEAHDLERKERFTGYFLEATLVLEGLDETQSACKKLNVDVSQPQYTVLRFKMAISAWDVDAINEILQTSADSSEIDVREKLRLLLELSETAKRSTAFEAECGIGISVEAENRFLEGLLAQPDLAERAGANFTATLAQLSLKLRLSMSLPKTDDDVNEEEINTESEEAICKTMSLLQEQVSLSEIDSERLEWFRQAWWNLAVRPAIPPELRFRLLEQYTPFSTDLRSRLDCRLMQLASAIEHICQERKKCASAAASEVGNGGPVSAARPQFDGGFLEAMGAAVNECAQMLASEELAVGEDRQEAEKAGFTYFIFKVKLALLLYDDLECVEAVLQDSFAMRNPRLILALCVVLKEEVRELGYSGCVAVDGLVLHALYVAARVAVTDRAPEDDPEQIVFLFDVLICEALEQQRLDIATQHVEAFASFLSGAITTAAIQNPNSAGDSSAGSGGAEKTTELEETIAKVTARVWNSAVEAGLGSGNSSGRVELGNRLKQLCRSLLPYTGKHKASLEGHLLVFS